MCKRSTTLACIDVQACITSDTRKRKEVEPEIHAKLGVTVGKQKYFILIKLSIIWFLYLYKDNRNLIKRSDL